MTLPTPPRAGRSATRPLGEILLEVSRRDLTRHHEESRRFQSCNARPPQLPTAPGALRGQEVAISAAVILSADRCPANDASQNTALEAAVILFGKVNQAFNAGRLA